MLNAVSLPLHFQVENLELCDAQSHEKGGREKQRSQRPHGADTTYFLSLKHKCLPSEWRVTTLENHVLKIIPNKVQNINIRWNRLKKSKNQQNREVKNIWNAHKELFSVLVGVRFLTYMYHFPLKQSFWGCRAMEGYCERPWNISIGQQEEEEPRTHGQRRYCETSQWLTPPAWKCLHTPMSDFPRPDSKQPHLLIKCQHQSRM